MGTVDTPPAAGTAAIIPAKEPRLRWTREEVILAMDFYIRHGGLNGRSMPDENSPEIAELSRLLKSLNAYPPEKQGEKYRNGTGVYLKLMNLLAVHSHGLRGMGSISKVDSATWRDYCDNLDELHAEAEAIRLRVADGSLTPAQTATENRAEDVAIEQQHSERFMVNPSSEPREAERAEQKLVLSYRDYLTSKGIAACRKRYRPTGQVRPIFCDIWVEALNILIEAKSSDSRDALRHAIGQLYDYRRFHDSPPRLAVLLPYRPSKDGTDLLLSAGIDAIWPHGTGFRDSTSGTII